MRKTERAILFAVTSSVSLPFLQGQVRLLAQRSWRAGLASDPTVSGQLEEFARQEGAASLPVPMHREINPRADLKSLVQMYQTLRRFRPTVTNVGTPKAGLIGGLAAVAARVPVRVYTLHGLRLETAQGVKRQILSLSERIALACAHRVVCVSPSLRDRVQELGLAPAHKTLVLGAGSVNGVRLPPLADLAQAKQLRHTLGLGANQPVVGFVGRFTRDKGITELLQAFGRVRAQFPSVALLLIGDYEDGDPVSPQVREAIAQTSGIIRTGFVPDVYPYYPLMNVLAFPTHREGLGLVSLEAAAHEIPSVVTRATGARDTVQHGVTGWQVPVSDADALAAALVEALAHPSEACQRGKAGRRWVEANFRQEDVQQRWAALYDDLLRWQELSQQRPGKRLFDVLVAGSGLLILSAPLLVLALLVRWKLGSPILFKQVRPGLDGQPFTMYKFRTMTSERSADGELLPDSARLTPFGRFLRSTSLDELPELLNVLRGEMSLVGPRPLLTRYTPYFTAEEAQRMNMRPGITGWAQVNGRNTVSWDERLALDVWYVRNWSMALDIKILGLTLLKVFRRSGVVIDPESIMRNLDDERRERVIT